MQICLMIEGQEDVSWSQWLALAAACEESGVPALFRSDHYMNLDGRAPGRVALDAWATINALAAVTSSVRLGTLVSPATFRHPSALAKMVTTADHVSGGRIELGLGAGWHEREHEAYGFPFPPLGARMDTLEEQLQVVFGNWGEGPFSFDGEQYRLRDLDAQPKPIQRPHPPLIMGGMAGPRSARLAAVYADEYNTAFPTVEDVRHRKAQIDQACERAGRDPIPFSVMTAAVVGVDDSEVAARLRRLGEKTGVNPDDLAANPPPPWIVGTLDAAAEQLGALSDAGVSRVMCQHLVHDDLDMVTLLGRDLPRLLA
jgi:F420-dependent oxidoreductase-like protein